MFLNTVDISEKLIAEEKEKANLKQQLTNQNKELNFANDALRHQSGSFDDEREKNEAYEEELFKISEMNETLAQEKRILTENNTVGSNRLTKR